MAVQRAEARARVQALFWDRIDEAGMQRPRHGGSLMTLDDYQAMRRRLCDRLAYLDPDNLLTLAELMICNASGPARPRLGVWPEAAILSEAKALQVPPVADLPIITSWLASIEGPPAVAGGFEVELYRHLRRTGRPPLPYDMHRIREGGVEANRQIELVQGRIDRDVATAEDRAWLEAYQRDRQAVAQIVKAGQDKRSEQSA
ncbi:MAG: hypothetical protein KKB02_16025 [Alphaproteobacteria bacterium]|nr:hypothetical protein [Alphaproteobacteria bacterium]